MKTFLGAFGFSHARQRRSGSWTGAAILRGVWQAMIEGFAAYGTAFYGPFFEQSSGPPGENDLRKAAEIADSNPWLFPEPHEEVLLRLAGLNNQQGYKACNSPNEIHTACGDCSCGFGCACWIACKEWRPPSRLSRTPSIE